MSTRRLCGVIAASTISTRNAAALGVEIEVVGSLALCLATFAPGISRRHRLKGLLWDRRLQEALLTAGPVLPVRSDTPCLPREALVSMAETHQRALEAALERVRDCEEHQVVVRWDPGEVLRRFAAKALTGTALIDAAEHERTALRMEITAALGAHASARLERPAEEPAVVAAAAIVVGPYGDTRRHGSGNEEQLDQALEAADACSPGALIVSANGPLPLVSFECLALEVTTAAEFESAAETLGMADAPAHMLRARRRDLLKAAGRAGDGSAISAIKNAASVLLRPPRSTGSAPIMITPRLERADRAAEMVNSARHMDSIAGSDAA